MNLRNLARGKPCQIRALGCISGGANETTVLAHVRMSGLSGMGIKALDFFGAWACSACHDHVDGRTPSLETYERRRLDLLEGVMRTQREIFEMGYALSEAEVSRG